MQTHRHLNALVAAVLLAQTLLPSAALAATVAAKTDTALTVNGVTVIVNAGSTYDQLTTSADALTLTVPSGEAAILRTSGAANVLENDAMLPACHVLRNKTNQLTINGPRTVVVRPQPTTCSTANANDADDTGFAFSAPSESAVWNEGAAAQLFWTTSGRAPASVRVRLSSDGGSTYPVLIAENVASNGFLEWTVPTTYTTSQARVKIEAIEQGNVTAIAVSPAFTVNGTATAPTNGGGLVVTPYDYDPKEETRDAATIGVDKHLPNRPDQQICTPGIRLKAAGFSAVYYCGQDGKRYVFPNQKIYDTWYAGDFAGVVELPLSDVQRIPLGGNVTYRPGSRMVKLTTATEVFAVAADGTLRFVTSEQVAARLYGPNWNTMIDDLPDAFFTDYTVGEPIY